ncbi:hypothetical protein D3C74_350640 [compost metagenome]
MQVTNNQLFIIRQLNAACWLIVVESFLDPFKHFNFLLILLVAALHIFTGAVNSFFHTIQVSQNQLQINRLNVADRVDFTINVSNILILKAANDMNNRIHLTDMSQKFVS